MGHKTTLALAVTLAAAVNAATPTGNYGFAVHADFSGGDGTNSTLLVSGKADGDSCDYVGKVRLPKVGGKCPSVLVLHLYSVTGGSEGLQCGYDRSIFGDEMFSVTELRSHCPDLLAIDHKTWQVRGEYDYGKYDNQADYWDKDYHCGFTYDVSPDYFYSDTTLMNQVLYRKHYDWTARIPNGR